MKSGLRHWPFLLALVLGLAIFFANREQEPGHPTPGERPSVDDDKPPSAAPIPGSEQGIKAETSIAPANPDPFPSGSLRVTFRIAAGSLRGHLVILSADNVSESAQEVIGEGTEAQRVPKLKPGAKTVVYVPNHTHLAAFAEVVIAPAQEAEVSFTLKEAAEIKGTVVDSLQKPLPGAKVEVTIAGVIPPRAGTPGPNSLWSEFGGRSAGRSGGGVVISFSRQLDWDGSLKKSITTDRNGEFVLDGVVGPAVTVEISYKEVRFTQGCKTDANNLFIAPVVWEPPARNLEAEELRRSTTEILRQMALHPESSEAYAAQLRDILTRNLEKSTASPAMKEEIRKHIEAIGRPSPPREPR